MPNAKDVTAQADERILVRGSIGTGKTTQFLTLPGRKFLYIFEPSGLQAIRGYDVTYEMYLQEKLNITVKAIPKGLVMGAGNLSDENRLKAQAFAQWERHFLEAIDNGFFNDFDVIGFDSITSLVDIAMDDVLARDGRLEYPPVLPDYNVVKVMIARILRFSAALGKVLFFTAHTMYRQTSEASRKILNEMLIPGDLQVRGPLLFSTVMQMSYKLEAGGKKTFMAQTVIDDHNENLKTNLPSMLPHHNVTIEDFNNPEEYGIGKLIKEARETYARRAQAS